MQGDLVQLSTHAEAQRGCMYATDLANKESAREGEHVHTHKASGHTQKREIIKLAVIACAGQTGGWSVCETSNALFSHMTIL